MSVETGVFKNCYVYCRCWPSGFDWLNLENTEMEFMFACFDWLNSENTEWEFLYCSIYGRK